jgi:hypothetical protein
MESTELTMNCFLFLHRHYLLLDEKVQLIKEAFRAPQCQGCARQMVTDRMICPFLQLHPWNSESGKVVPRHFTHAIE